MWTAAAPWSTARASDRSRGGPAGAAAAGGRRRPPSVPAGHPDRRLPVHRRGGRRPPPASARPRTGVHAVHTMMMTVMTFDEKMRIHHEPTGAGRDPRAPAGAARSAHPWSEPSVNLSVMQENLARGLSVVSRAVSTRNTLPVLANVLLKTEDAGLKLTATNLEIGITYWVPGQDRDRRRDHRPGPAPDRRRQLAARRRARRPRAPGRRRRSTSGAAGSRRTSRASTPTSSRRSRPPASGPTTRVPQKVLRQALERDGVRRGERRGPADPDRRPAPGSRATSSRWPPPTTTGSRSRRSRSSTRSRRRASSSRPASLNELAADPRRHRRPGRRSSWPAPRNQILFHLEGIDLVSRLIDGQFPNYQQVLPAGPRHAGRPRSRGAPQGRPAGGAHRQRSRRTSSSSRSGVDGEPGITVTANAEVGDNEGRVEAAGRGRRHDDRVQRPLPRRRPPERRRRPVRARAQRAALAGRVQAGRRRPATSTS